MRRVDLLWADDFLDLELEVHPSTVDGGFELYRLEEFLMLARLHPEFHIVASIDVNLYINAFVRGGFTYYLGQGDANPSLVHDPDLKLDTYLLHSLNSGCKRSAA